MVVGGAINRYTDMLPSPRLDVMAYRRGQPIGHSAIRWSGGLSPTSSGPWSCSRWALSYKSVPGATGGRHAGQVWTNSTG